MADVLVLYKTRDDLPMVMTSEYIDKIKETVSGEVYWCATEEEVLEKNIDAEVLFIWGGSGKMPVQYCLQSKKLKWINSFSAGVNPIMDSPIANLPITLTNSSGIHGRTMALTTIGYMISFLRGFPQLQVQQKEHVWKKITKPTPRDTEGLTVAIIGAGSIGSEVARLSSALGMKVLGVKRTVVPMEYYDEVYSNNDMDIALGQADFVVLLTPLTEATHHLMNKEKLEKMKDSAVLINISRGPVVDEAALITALQKGTIAGAALDATEIEPLAVDSPLWDMENVIITPHNSADSILYMDRAINLFLDNLKRYENGELLVNKVNLADK